jgi:siroheme synthase-like protein
MKRRSQASPYYPIFLNISGKKCVVVGGGPVALRKVRALLEHGANVKVISPALCPELSQLGQDGTVRILRRDYVPGDLEDALITVAATDDSRVNGRVATEARKRGGLVNVVDDPQRSDFIVPSYLRRGDITIAVSTGGRSPALAQRIRAKLEESLGAEYASLALLVGEVRSELKQRGITVDSHDWQEVLDLDSLIYMVQAGRNDEVRALLFSSLEELRRKES